MLYEVITTLWLRRHILMSFASGLIWGLLSLFYDPGWPIPQQVILFVVIAGLAAGTMSAYAAVLESYVVFLVPLFVITSYSIHYTKLYEIQPQPYNASFRSTHGND